MRNALFVAGLGLFALTACPAPPEQTNNVPGPGAHPAGQGQPGGPAHAEQQMPQGEEGNAEEGRRSDADTAGLPNFTSLIESGAETVTLSGSYAGGGNGMVDVAIAHRQGEWVVPKIVHQADVTDGSFSFDAPQEYTVDVYLTFVKDATGDGPSPDDQMIRYHEAVTIGTADIALEFVDGAEVAWGELFSELPDPDAGSPVLDGPPPGAELNPVPINPVPNGAEGDLGSLGVPVNDGPGGDGGGEPANEPPPPADEGPVGPADGAAPAGEHPPAEH